jgi:hypothetical protein
MFSNQDNARFHLGFFNLPESLPDESISYYENTRQSIHNNVGMRLVEHRLPLDLIEKTTLQFYSDIQNYADIKIGETNFKSNPIVDASNPILLNPFLIKNSAYLAVNIALAINLWENGDDSDEELKKLKTRQTELMIPAVSALTTLRLIIDGHLKSDNIVIPSYHEVLKTLLVPCSEDFDQIIIV